MERSWLTKAKSRERGGPGGMTVSGDGRWVHRRGEMQKQGENGREKKTILKYSLSPAQGKNILNPKMAEEVKDS